MAQTVRLDTDNIEGLLSRAQSILSNCGIVAFPTETVYGLCVRGDDPSAVEALFQAKGRPAAQPVARYISQSDEIEPASPAAHRLARAFWPGPMTLVLPDTKGGDPIGYRYPSHEFMVQLSARCDFPIVGTSANTSGSPPLHTAAEIASAFDDTVGLIVDDGPSSNGLPSTVVQVSENDTIRILRQGAIASSRVERVGARLILLVCTGNTCRSPLAEVMARAILKERGLNSTWQVASAGLAASARAPASDLSLRVAARRGLDLQPHRSQPITEELLLGCDIILTMTAAHRDALMLSIDGGEGLVRTLGGDSDVPDPFGADEQVYEACAVSIEDHLKKFVEEL